MAGFLPAPANVPPVLVGLDGATPLSSADGPILLRPGVGLFGRSDKAAQTLRIDGRTSGPAESLCAALQTPAAGVLARWTNPRPDTTAVVNIVDVSLFTPPTADASNHHALRVTGAQGGLGTVPLLSAFQSLDFATPTGVAGCATVGAATGLSENQSADYTRGLAFGFRPTATKRIQSFSVVVRDSSTLGAGNWLAAGIPKLFELLDSQLAPIYSFPTTAGIIAGTTYTVPLPVEIELTQDTTYYVAVMRTDGPTARGITLGNTGVRRADSAAPTAGDPTQGYTALIMSSNVVNLLGVNTRWADLGLLDAAGRRTIATNGGFLPAGSNGSGGTNTVKGSWGAVAETLSPVLSGSTGGFTATGSILVELVTVGIGPTAPGAGLNVRVALEAE